MVVAGRTDGSVKRTASISWEGVRVLGGEV